MKAPRPPGAALLAFLDKGLEWLCRIMLAAGAVLVIAMTAIVSYSVFMRYVMNTPQVWTDELVGYLLVLLVMLGAAEALRRGEHIAVDLVTERLGPLGRRLTEIWGMAAVLAVSAALTVTGWQMTRFSIDMEMVSDGYLEVPMWIPQVTIPIGAGVLGLAALNRLVRLLFGYGDSEPVA